MNYNNQINLSLEEEKKYFYNIEFMRFIAALLIMGHHLYLFGFTGEYIFNDCWAWVDFFFIITGAFTYKHFCSGKKVERNNYDYEAFHYTIMKYRKFFLLTFFSVIGLYFYTYGYLLKIGRWRSFIVELLDAPFEILYLSSSGSWWAQHPPIYVPIWFLSAMFIVLPIIIYLMQARPGFWKVLSLLIPIIYFGYKGVNTDRLWPNDLFRAFSCISLGTVAYLLSSELSMWTSGTLWRRVLLSIIEIILILMAIYITVFNKSCINLIEPLFLFIISLMISGVTFSFYFKGKTFFFLGKLSMPMYILHWLIGFLSRLFTTNITTQIIIYFLGTIIISFVYLEIFLIIENIIKGKNKSLQYAKDK